MYTTCLFCHGPLGRNQAIEHFPVGRRLAFDAAKGRLWVVCPRCARWNLSPLEERWEAIEECERAFRDTRLRASTDNIGMARVGEGLELVRIGAPQRPEFAAWRYGGALMRRKYRTIALAGAGILGGGALYAGGVSAGLITMSPIVALYYGRIALDVYLRRATAARIPVGPGAPLTVRGEHLAEVRLLPRGGTDEWILQVPHDLGVKQLSGARAQHAAGLVLSRINRIGYGRDDVEVAIRLLTARSDPEAFVRSTLRGAAIDLDAALLREQMNGDRKGSSMGLTLASMPVLRRLALEMAVSESSERRALEGELAELEAAWREAEEVASISDALFVPPQVAERLEQLRRTILGRRRERR